MRLTAMHDANAEKVLALGRAAKSTMQVFRYLEQNPIIDIGNTAAALGMTFNTASSAVKRLTELGILVQTANASRNRVFAYEEYLAALRKGT